MTSEIEYFLNEYGYNEYKLKPTASELEEYYSKIYYQKLTSSTYQHTYDQEELLYIKNKIEQKFYVVKNILKLNPIKKFLDVGCGEGFSLKYFAEQGCEILGLDYSNHGCDIHNPSLAKNIMTGKIEDNLEKLISNKSTFDIILLDNVLEHLIDPKKCLNQLNKILTPNGILIIEVPNEFSFLQMLALKRDFIPKPFWVSPPDHLHYFNQSGLAKLCLSAGFTEKYCTLDFPIDINLIHEAANFKKLPQTGKAAYRQKIIIENELHSQGIGKTIEFFHNLTKVNIGRVLTSYFTKS